MSGQPVADAATYTKDNEHKRRISMPSDGFEHPDPSNEEAADGCLIPHGNRGRYVSYLAPFRTGLC